MACIENLRQKQKQQWLKNQGFPEAYLPDDEISERKDFLALKNTIKLKRSRPSIRRKVTITLMFGSMKLEGFWSSDAEESGKGGNPGRIRAGTVPAVSKPFIKHSTFENLNRSH